MCVYACAQYRHDYASVVHYTRDASRRCSSIYGAIRMEIDRKVTVFGIKYDFSVILVAHNKTLV